MIRKALAGAFQIAYVTNDMDQARRRFADLFNVHDFMMLDPVEMKLLAGGTACITAALGYVGDTCYEIIQPHWGEVEPYTRRLAGADEFVLRFHHVGHFLDSMEDYEQTKREHIAAGHPIVIESTFGDSSRVVYHDTTRSLGHFLEYMVLDESGRDFFASVPRNTV